MDKLIAHPWVKTTSSRHVRAWYIKYFKARVNWRQKPGSKWQGMEWEQRKQDQTLWTLEWSMPGWIWEEIFLVYEWLTVGTKYLMKWKEWKYVRSSGRPTKCWEQPSWAAPNGKGVREPARCERGATRSWCSLRGSTWATGDDFTSKKVSKTEAKPWESRSWWRLRRTGSRCPAPRRSPCPSPACLPPCPCPPYPSEKKNYLSNNRSINLKAPSIKKVKFLILKGTVHRDVSGR